MATITLTLSSDYTPNRPDSNAHVQLKSYVGMLNKNINNVNELELKKTVESVALLYFHSIYSALELQDKNFAQKLFQDFKTNAKQLRSINTEIGELIDEYHGQIYRLFSQQYSPLVSSKEEPQKKKVHRKLF